MANSFEILSLMLSTRNGGKILSAVFSDDKQKMSKKMSYLKRRGYVSGSGMNWNISSSGRSYLERKISFRYFSEKLIKGSKDEYLLMFDIPEEKRPVRNYLRAQLKKFGYHLVQKSVWFGPGPLPDVFLAYTKELGIKENLIIFKTKRQDI